MGRYFALTLNIPETQSKPKKAGKISILPKLSFLVLAMLVVFGIVYLIQVNGLSTKGYDIKKLEQRMTELKELEERLEIEAAALQSIQSMERQIRDLNLIPSGAVKYFSNNGYTLK